MINDLKESDLLIVKTCFFCIRGDPAKQNSDAYYDYYNYTLKEGDILLVLENNFGATFKDRYTACLLENKVIYYRPKQLHNECLEMINESETYD